MPCVQKLPAFRSLLQAVAVALLLAGSSVRAEDPESIQDFVARSGRWDALVGARFTLEGRVAIIGAQNLRFDRCDLEFRLPPKLPTLPRGTRVAQVVATLARHEGKLVMDVAELKALNTDLQTLAARRSRLDSTKPKEWYALADWAEKRGTFYQDPELIGKALELREVALMSEYRRFRPDDVDALLELAKRANSLGLTETVGWRCIHDASRIQLMQLRRQDRPDDSVLINRILKQLPGADKPLPAEDEPLRTAYQAAPNDIYHDADTSLRKKLHRILYSEVMLARIERDARSDGSNGEAIAQRIQQQIPELTPLVDKYRQKEISYLTSRIESLSRDELQRLVSRYEAQQRTDDVAKVRKEWLKGQERTRRAEGPQGLIELAQDYVRLLKDERTAAELFQEAYRLNPKMPEPSEWLTSHGFVLKDERWYPAELAPRSEADRFSNAVREGRVLKGMTEAQVRAAMGARPTSVLRNAARSRVSELWIYKSQGLAISLTKSGQADAKVEKVISIDR